MTQHCYLHLTQWTWTFSSPGVTQLLYPRKSNMDAMGVKFHVPSVYWSGPKINGLPGMNWRNVHHMSNLKLICQSILIQKPFKSTIKWTDARKHRQREFLYPFWLHKGKKVIFVHCLIRVTNTIWWKSYIQYMLNF